MEQQKQQKCEITWCHASESLMRRKETSPLFKRFGQIVLCKTHVPAWRLEEYEPLDPAARTPEPAPQEKRARAARGGAAAPPATPKEPEAPPKAEAPGAARRSPRVKAKAEGAPF